MDSGDAEKNEREKDDEEVMQSGKKEDGQRKAVTKITGFRG